MRLAALLAALVSGYLVWGAYSGTGGLGCSGGFDCDEVLSSGWSTWFGIPVSLPALSLYLSLFISLAFSGSLMPENVRRMAWTLSLALSVTAGAAALWFTGLQLFVVGKFCSWCLTVHMCGLGLFALAFIATRSALPQWRAAGAVALSGLAALLAGQLLGPSNEKPQMERVAAETPPVAAGEGPSRVTAQRLTVDDLYADVDDSDDVPAHHQDPIDDTELGAPPPPPSLDDLNVPSSEPPDVAAETGGEIAPIERSTRVVSLFRGSAQIDVYQHPLLGSPAAPHVIVKLFDYTCPHCRMMHQHLAQARTEFGDQLAVVMCPVPLNKQCNPHVQFDNPKHAEACELARLALAVWQADPARFAEFDEWLFAPALHPSAASARQKAEALVGAEALSKQLYSDQLRQRLAVGPKLYKLLGAGTVPKLLLPTGMLVGPGQGTEQVILELKKEFAEPSRPVLP
jgi:uncharacterized membrane protein/protein-disulfide isomerase